MVCGTGRCNNNAQTLNKLSTYSARTKKYYELLQPYRNINTPQLYKHHPF